MSRACSGIRGRWPGLPDPVELRSEDPTERMSLLFPKWSNRLPLQLIVFGALLAGTVVLGATYYLTPKYTRVGYAPTQPVPFSHALHAGQLGLDCRYCHNFVEQSGHSNVPSASTCMNCHSHVRNQSPLLAQVRASYTSGEAVPWVRIHKAPDYVYFDHSVHIARGVSCYNCHGAIHEMEVVEHAKAHSMGFCLECHREPEKFLRPQDKVFAFGDAENGWAPLADGGRQATEGKALVEAWNVKPPLSCSGCHR